MAVEGTDASVVETPVSTTEPTGKPATAATTGDPNPADKWAKEREGLIRDLQKERQKHQTYETQVAAFKTQVEDQQKRMAALAGVTTRSPEEENEEAVRARFKQLFPHLADLSKDDVEALRESKKFRETVVEMEKRHWDSHAKRMFTPVQERVQKELGVDLTPRQVKALQAAYVAEADTDPEFAKRFEQGDDKLVEDFVKNWVEDWITPIRRKVEKTQADTIRRTPLGKDRSFPGPSSGKKINLLDNDEVADALVAGVKARGGEFGRR